MTEIISGPVNSNPWHRPLYADLHESVDPFRDLHRFRPLDRAYDGDNTFWQVPSPEPPLDDVFWGQVQVRLDSEPIRQAGIALAQRILSWESRGDRLIFAAILRAGVPIADWLCRMIPGSECGFISLFVGLGVDHVALQAMQRDWPDRRIVFVDGWTGRGGVAREIAKLGKGPLAVLIDPWGWADFSGTRQDLFCPTACFTGVATLGFSRTFYQGPDRMFAAYRFPTDYCRPDLVRAWQSACPQVKLQSRPDMTEKPFFTQTPLRIHANEVCRALINADPDTLFFYDQESIARTRYSLLISLAKRRQVKMVFNQNQLANLNTRVACSMKNAVN